MATLKDTIKSWFKTGSKPTQEQFWAWMDSFRHNDEKIPITAIDNIEDILGAKAEAQALANHINAKGEANGYAPLDSLGKIAAVYLNVIDDLTTGGSDALASAETVKTLKGLIDGINTLLASDNVDLDNVQELVDAIETVQTSLSTILINDLTTGGVTKALTAEQGKVLKALIDDLATSKANISSPVFLNSVELPLTKMTGISKIYWLDDNHRIQYIGNNVMEIREFGTLKLIAATIQIIGALDLSNSAIQVATLYARLQTSEYVVRGEQRQGNGAGQVSALAKFYNGNTGSGFYLSTDPNLNEAGIATSLDNFNIICPIARKIKFRRSNGNAYYGLNYTANESTEIAEFDANDNLRVKGFDLSQLGSYSNDAAAASGGVLIGFAYINSNTGALQRRLI